MRAEQHQLKIVLSDESPHERVRIADGQPCRRADLEAWSIDGGPLPPRLARHVMECSKCSAYVRRVSEVQAGLTLLCTQTAPPDLTARANGRALRFLKRAARASAAAERLLRMRPDLTRAQRLYIHGARISVGVAAAALTLLLRFGVMTGFERAREIGDTLADRQWQHWQKEADPSGEWIGRRPTV